MSVTFTVEIDWDHDGTWTDETGRIRRVQIKSGFEHPGDAVAAVGRCTLTLDNHDRRFTPGEPTSPLAGKLLPRRAVRVQASDGVTVWTLFRGLIDAIQPDAGAWGGGECRMTASDGLALLATQRVGVAHEDTKSVQDAIGAVVAAAYAPPATDYADNGDTLTHYGRAWTPELTTCQDALRDICDAVHGRFYIARDGTAVYQSRAYRQNSSVSPAIFVGEVAYWQRAKEIRRANLLAYWRLNELAGATANDSGDLNHDATVSGITWGAAGIGDTSGTAGGAAHFDGAHGWINLFSESLHSAFYDEAGSLLLWVRARAELGVERWHRALSRAAGREQQQPGRTAQGRRELGLALQGGRLAGADQRGGQRRSRQRRDVALSGADLGSRRRPDDRLSGWRAAGQPADWPGQLVGRAGRDADGSGRGVHSGRLSLGRRSGACGAVERGADLRRDRYAVGCVRITP